MKNVDDALELHLQEFYESLKRPPTKGSIPIPSEEKAREIQAAFDKMAADGYDFFARRRGRPLAIDSKNERTSQSFRASLFVYEQMWKFRRRNSIKRVPAEVRDAFIELAKQSWFPKAVDEIVLEYLRESKNIFPDLGKKPNFRDDI